MSNFENFLPLKISLVSTISETRALTFRKYIAGKVRAIQDNAKLMNYFDCTPPFLL